jgi:signal transduction histidine kinase
VPVAAGEGVAGAVRASSSRRVVQGRVVGAWAAMLGLASFAALCAVLLARVQARRVARPLEQLEEMAEQLGDGNFAVRAAPSGIAEIDGAGDSLNRTAERLGDLVARERAFSAQASHQLRTPLTGLRLGLDSALSSPDGDLRAAAAEAIVAADQLERTIDDLLALARGGAATGEALDVGAFLEDVRARWHGLLAAAGRPLRVVEEDAPPVCASVAAIRQILEVFMDNAYRHGKGTVTITARDSGGALAIDVADEGSAVLPRVPVTPPSPLASPDAEGSGRKPRRLGLTLARTLAEAEGGRILLSGSPSPTRATLLLPPTSTGEDRDADPTGGDAGHEESEPSAR